jgi:isopentenyl diphosphate isomerase/L-lactate dehydrogenase-like FMN-dependent dehydrogenase
VLVWFALGTILWLAIAAAFIAPLTMSKRANAIAEADFRRYAETAARTPAVPARPELDRLAEAVRRELAVDQVLIVTRDRLNAPACVAVAAAGFRAPVVGRSLAPRESIAAAVALTGYALIAPDHAPLDRPTAPAAGDAAAVPLTGYDGAVAVGRLGADRRLTAEDLRCLRTLLRRFAAAQADAPPPPAPVRPT